MNAFEPIELDEHDGLLWVEVPTEGLSDVWDEGDHDRERLRSQS
jgi:hypothetical protein